MNITRTVLAGIGYFAFGFTLSGTNDYWTHPIDTNDVYAEDVTMEAWGEDFGKKWESREKELDAVVEGSTKQEIKLNFDSDENQEEEKKDTPKKSKKTTYNVTELHFGANSLRDASGYETSTETLLSNWQSTNFRLSFGTKRKIFGAASPLVLQTGIGFTGNAFSFTGNNTILKVPASSTGAGATTEIAPATNLTNISRNRLNQIYFEIPVMLHLDFSPSGKIDKSLNVGLGGYGGIRLDSKSTLLGNDSEGERAMIVTTSNYNTHLFRYGVQAQLGYKAWKVTGRLDARTLFQDKAFNEEVYIGSLNLGVAF